MKNDLVSIIIPVYNVEKYLRQCLDSVFNQTYTDYEVIMVDDGSQDSSAEICKEYQRKDSRFILIQKSNGGVASARNMGLDNANGRYVFFLDCDDWIENEAINLLVSAAESEKADLVFFESSAFDDDGVFYERMKHTYHIKYRADDPYRIMKEMMYHKEFVVVVWSLFVERSVFEDNSLRFNEGYYYEDMIMSYQIYSFAHLAAHVNKSLYNRRYRADSFTARSKNIKHFLSAINVYEKVVQFTTTLPEEKKNYQHVVRCALIALNDYKALSRNERKEIQKQYKQLKNNIAKHDFFFDNALRCRCMGYYCWAAYKFFQKVFIGEKYDYSNLVRINTLNKKKVLLLISEMVGGGAERVSAQLISQMNSFGVDTKYFVSKTSYSHVIKRDLNDNIPLILLHEEMPNEAILINFAYKALKTLSSALCKPFEALKKPVPASFAKLSVVSQNHREIQFIRGMLQAEPDLSVIAFLQPTIPIALLAAQDLPNRIIISERADPNRLMKKRYGRKFIERYYTRADTAVFQTYDAKEVYPKAVADKGTGIFNPLKPDLPEPYHGERNKNITTFCRISNQKNLLVMIDAFNLLHKDHPDYTLRIIGDAPNDEGEQVLRTIKKMIADYSLQDAVLIEPFKANVHEVIIKDAMYVNSSDYEGISNAMLEALAIGMPVVCTDCPIGGAKATITDGVNGVLVPIQDADALYRGMKRVIEDEALAQSLSENASKLRKELSLDTITQKWMDLL